MDLQTIQSIIDERAERKLNDELDFLFDMIKNHSLLNPTGQKGFPQLKFGSEEKDPYYLFSSRHNESFYEKLKEYWLPLFKSTEAKNFIRDVVQMQENVSQLLDVNPIPKYDY